jgi:lipopolysaccharide biosynthesis glycosyltransferase
MVAECAICYVADRDFLLPSLIAATRARKFVPAHKADIFVFAVDEDEARIAELNRFFEVQAIRVLPMDSRSFTGFDMDKFDRSDAYIPPAALGRFSIESLLPSSCKKIIYMDGDTWACGDLSRLIETDVPQGRFAAAEDAFSFCRNDITPNGRVVREYFAKLGIDPRNGYFNSGVLAAERNTWRQITGEAYRFFAKDPAACRYHDQSALNAVVGDRRLKLSLAWNFQTPYRHLGVESRIAPQLYHFTHYPKPWMGTIEPWREMFELYQDESRLLAPLNLSMKTVSDDEAHAANRHTERQNFKMSYILPVRLWLRRRDICAYQAEAFC